MQRWAGDYGPGVRHGDDVLLELGRQRQADGGADIHARHLPGATPHTETQGQRGTQGRRDAETQGQITSTANLRDIPSNSGICMPTWGNNPFYNPRIHAESEQRKKDSSEAHYVKTRRAFAGGEGS